MHLQVIILVKAGERVGFALGFNARPSKVGANQTVAISRVERKLVGIDKRARYQPDCEKCGHDLK